MLDYRHGTSRPDPEAALGPAACACAKTQNRRSAVRAGQSLVDLILQDMRGAKHEHAPRQDGDLFAGHWVAPDALALLANREAADGLTVSSLVPCR